MGASHWSLNVKPLHAGYQVAKDALGGALSSEHLSIGGRKWKLRRGKDNNDGDILLPGADCQNAQAPSPAHCGDLHAKRAQFQS